MTPYDSRLNYTWTVSIENKNDGSDKTLKPNIQNIALLCPRSTTAS